jgi:hypothetical protein
VTTWDETFTRWSKPPSETEEAKAGRAARMVRESLREHAALRDHNFDVVAVGSYRNNTNVRSASDVDLAAVLRSATYLGLPGDGSITRESLGLGVATYELPQFRADISRALRERFGSSDIAPGKLTLTVGEGSARLGADVTPYLGHRRYRAAPVGGAVQTCDGIETRPSDEPNRRIIQWPEQHYSAGVAKNDATNHRFKRIVRILKCLRNELADGPKAGGDAPSCFLEHAVFNAPNTSFNRQEGSYDEDVKAVLGFLWGAARDGSAKKFVEVSGMEWVFRPGETWTPALLEGFALAAWQHVGFKS